jgi:hypothetical protein
MSDDAEDKIDTILEHVKKLSRGMYGDPDNGLKGLIKENQEQESRLNALETKVENTEKFQKDLKWWIGKIAAGVSVAVGVVWTLIKQRLGL